jgi:hypothetical protein
MKSHPQKLKVTNTSWQAKARVRMPMERWLTMEQPQAAAISRAWARPTLALK